MRSLALKLTLAFLAVSVLGAALLAFLIHWQTQRQFNRLVYDLYQDELVELSDRLALYYQQTASWEGIEAIVIRNRPRQRGRQSRVSVMLVDADREILYSGRRYPPGERLSRWQVNRGVPIVVDGDTVGWILLDTHDGGFPANSPEANFLRNINRATLLSALGAAAIALMLGVLLARTISHPISELEEATQLVAQGRLGHQVPVRSQDEIGQLAASFNRMSADLARSNELRQQMTADIAHDLRTPLSVIQGYTEALDEGKLASNPAIFHAMHQQAQHLTRLVEDLRTLSLADAGQLPLQRQQVDPQTLLEHSALVHQAQAEQQGITIRVEATPNLRPIEVDPDRMTQVLNNLLSNALRYTPAGGEILLSATGGAPLVGAQDTVTLKVQDTGAGIPPQDLPQIFERFYRADRSRSDNGASGLGLAIAKSLVEAHGGTIAVTSTPGNGTTFTMTIPRV